jgi:hypothetical protein
MALVKRSLVEDVLERVSPKMTPCNQGSRHRTNAAEKDITELVTNDKWTNQLIGATIFQPRHYSMKQMNHLLPVVS